METTNKTLRKAFENGTLVTFRTLTSREKNVKIVKFNTDDVENKEFTFETSKGEQTKDVAPALTAVLAQRSVISAIEDLYPIVEKSSSEKDVRTVTAVIDPFGNALLAASIIFAPPEA